MAAYKAMVKQVLEQRSTLSWRAQLVSSNRCPPTALLQEFPISVGARLFEENQLSLLWAVPDFDLLRTGQVSVTRAVRCHSCEKLCKMCDQKVGDSLVHVLALCPVVHTHRARFLDCLRTEDAIVLQQSLPGDWPIIVLNPHQVLERLAASVEFVSAVVQQIAGAS